MQVVMIFVWALLSFMQPTIPLSFYLVELPTGDTQCLKEWWESVPSHQKGTLKQMPIKEWMALQITDDQTQSLRDLPCVGDIRIDRQVTFRKTPNDPVYLNQSGMNLIGMPKAWDITTGGLTATGDTIVVAVLDDGFFIDHVDLNSNIFFNRFEIPDDGIDNDLNGYVDDFYGYNSLTENDNHQILNHGTGVSGIVGAVGNNGKGMTGVNWKVKIMPLSGGTHESQIILNYEYVYNMRRTYRMSNGERGAFVVATNLSAGIDNQFAEDHPLWCEMYDRLGEEGILNVIATANNSVNVDEVGDMPSTCTSPYMIAVTNTDLSDQLFGNGAYGATSIDLGAPGQGSMSLDMDGGIKDFPGTSAAAPYVAGAIALIYSTPCVDFLDGIFTDPVKIAEKVRDIIFDNVKPLTSLDGKSVTGGRLQVDVPLNEIKSGCGSMVTEVVRILKLNPNPVENGIARLEYQILGELREPGVEVFTTNGALIGTYSLDAEDIEIGVLEIPMGGLPAGMYLITLRNGKNKTTRKIFHR